MRSDSSDKSYVTLAQRVCQVCGKTYDTGELLLDKQLKKRFDMHTVVGMGLCPDCEKLNADGYIALVGIDESKSMVAGGTVTPENAHRTGCVAHIKREAFMAMFSVSDTPGVMVFADQSMLDLLQKRVEDGRQNTKEGESDDTGN